jgi:hypothetical protein
VEARRGDEDTPAAAGILPWQTPVQRRANKAKAKAEAQQTEGQQTQTQSKVRTEEEGALEVALLSSVFLPTAALVPSGPLLGASLAAQSTTHAGPTPPPSRSRKAQRRKGKRTTSMHA